MGSCLSLSNDKQRLSKSTRSLDLSRNVDYTEFIYHLTKGKGNVVESSADDNEDQPIISTFPLFITQMEALEFLNISFQFIKEIPAEIELLQNLRVLRCSDNKLVSISPSIGKLVNLEVLDLHNNCFVDLPIEICSLPSLISFDISGNSISHIPGDIINLVCLQRLNIADNKIEQFPYWLACLPCLTILICQRNPYHNMDKEKLNQANDVFIDYIRNYAMSHEDEITVVKEEEEEQVEKPQPVQEISPLSPNVANPTSYAPKEEVEMNDMPLSLFVLARSPLGHDELGPSNPSIYDIKDLDKHIAGIFYGSAIGDAIGVGSEYLSGNEVMMYYPLLSELMQYESLSNFTETNTSSISNLMHQEVVSEVESVITPSEASIHLPLHYYIKYADIIQDRHRIRWERGDWTEKTDLALLLVSSVLMTGKFNEYRFADLITQYKYEGITLFDDGAGFGLTNTLNILANDIEFTHNPTECSKAVWESANKSNTESQCLPHTLLLSILFFDDKTKMKEYIISCCRTTHYDLRCIGVCLLLSTILCQTLVNKQNLRESMKKRKELVAECFKSLTTYFQEKKDSNLMKRIIEIKDNWKDVIELIEEIHINQLGDIYEACLLGIFFYIYDYPYINAIMRVELDIIFVQGGNSSINSFVVGALIGAKLGVDEICLSAPLLVNELLHRDYLEKLINKVLDVMHL